MAHSVYLVVHTLFSEICHPVSNLQREKAFDYHPHTPEGDQLAQIIRESTSWGRRNQGLDQKNFFQTFLNKARIMI